MRSWKSKGDNKKSSSCGRGEKAESEGSAQRNSCILFSVLWLHRHTRDCSGVVHRSPNSMVPRLMNKLRTLWGIILLLVVLLWMRHRAGREGVGTGRAVGMEMAIVGDHSVQKLTKEISGNQDVLGKEVPR